MGIPSESEPAKKKQRISLSLKTGRLKKIKDVNKNTNDNESVPCNNIAG